MSNVTIFSFMILNLVKEVILDFHVTAVTDICLKHMKEVIRSCFVEHFKEKSWEHQKH